MDLKTALHSKKMIILTGTGGVGKTTLAAAIALQGVKAGKKTLALTIDPAKRLAQALKATPLEVMTLDTKNTFDTLIRRYAPSKEIQDKILNNRLYGYLSSMLAGTEEYMALEKLYELVESKQYDLIVLDTPPSRHAVSFLEAPDRLARFLDEKTLKWFLKPYFLAGKMSIRLISSGSYFVFKLIEKLTGLELLRELSEFLLNLQTLYTGFRERTLKVKEILKSKEAFFLLVTNPEKTLFHQALLFYKNLDQLEIKLGGVIVNRMTEPLKLDSKESQALRLLHEKKWSEGLQFKLDIFESTQALAHVEEKEVQKFSDLLPKSCPLYKIPSFDEGLYDIHGLNRLNLYLFR